MSKVKALWLPLGVLALLFVLAWPIRHAPAHWASALKAQSGLAKARTWHYQLDNINVDALTRVPADLLVIDYAKKDGKVPLTREEVARIKSGPDGRERIVLAYLSVGEAEEYRFYWRPEWKTEAPDWLGEENCAWPQAHRVRYWLQGWKDINFAADDSYLKRIMDAGFDGVYLDRVDIYETFEHDRPQARTEMIRYIQELAQTAWRRQPGFYIVPQNAEALLDSAEYRSAVDGIAKESLLNGLQATAIHNTAEQVEWSASRLEKLRQEGKPVFIVEYLLELRHMNTAAREARSYGFVPTFQTRALDGRDPTSPVKLDAEIGTPERTTKECALGTSW